MRADRVEDYQEALNIMKEYEDFIKKTKRTQFCLPARGAFLKI